MALRGSDQGIVDGTWTAKNIVRGVRRECEDEDDHQDDHSVDVVGQEGSWNRSAKVKGHNIGGTNP